MFFIININSKNLMSLNKFLDYFNNKIIYDKLNIKILKFIHKKPVKKKVITVLKSPHVNKSAQEQFEHRMYKKKIICVTKQPLLFLIVIKLLRFKYFSDIYITIKFNSDLSMYNKFLKQNLNFNVFNKNYLQKNFTICYLKILEIKGEFLTKKIKY